MAIRMKRVEILPQLAPDKVEAAVAGNADLHPGGIYGFFDKRTTLKSSLQLLVDKHTGDRLKTALCILRPVKLTFVYKHECLIDR